MIASQRVVRRAPTVGSKDVLERVSQQVFGDTEWVHLAVKSCTDHLGPAIRSGKPYRIANAIRAIAHAPTSAQIEDVVSAACDSMLADAYLGRDSRAIANVATAKAVAREVLSTVREHSADTSAVRLRDKVDSYLKIVALVNEPLAERLEAVGTLAGRIATDMQLATAQVLEAELAGKLHDIGKITPNGGKLAPRDRETHVALAQTFVESVPELGYLSSIIGAHHERYDGRGFPNRLSGDEIPLAARIVAVAGAFVDLITASTANGGSMTANDACRELILRAGADLDPDVVTATLHLLHYRQRSTNRSA